ncbi:MAG TPA: chloride channel protein [Acidimicrobiales bacterium]|nr:chloride channel protein [Acidimicrobiales bacterium]
MRRERQTERVRVPPPLISRRLPSGRGATEQPNVTGDGATPLTLRFWTMVVLTGVATGLFGDLLMFVLFHMQFLAFDYSHGSFQHAVEAVSPGRRVVSLVIAGVVGGVAWYVLRRYTPNESSDLDDEIWNGEGKLSFRRSIGTSLISETVIGMGASIGRESAPKLMGGVSGSVLGSWAKLTPEQRRLLVACGGGAGLACVYNVPVGGAILAAEVLWGSITLPAVLPALACSFIATATAWIYLPNHATYVAIPSYPFRFTLLVCSLLAGPVIGLLATGWVRLIGFVSHHRPRGRLALAGPLVAFVTLGIVGIWYPELFGNGKDMAHTAFLGGWGLGMLGALFVLKPIVTSLCVGSGAQGGLFTPTLSTGALFGGFIGLAWSQAWPGEPSGAFAIVGAAAMIGASMQAPFSGVVLVLELTHTGFAFAVPMLAATVGATLVTRHLDGYSIYSARLGPNDADSA